MRLTPQNSFQNLVLLNERTSTVLGSEKFRYGFQSQEKDDEVAGQGNSYTAEFWQYDSRLGRRWNRDPLIKEHESPYACFANNPIWFADPSGADSTLANGSNTWKWTVRKDYTYTKISERTGASVENLRLWNGVEDGKLQIGSELNISDPKAKGPASPGVMHTPAGDITILVRQTCNDDVSGRYSFGLTFAPNDANKGGEFVYYQTYVTNDANQDVYSGQYSTPEELEMFSYRCLRDPSNQYFGDDVLSGGNRGKDYANGGKGSKVHCGILFKPANGTVPFYDSPRRGNINIGTVKWDGYTQLLKKVDGKYIKVATLKWGFTMTGGVVVPNVTIFNPEVNSGDADVQHHNEKLNEYIKYH